MSIVWIDYVPRIAHNKVMILDSSTTITGSFNWITSANMHNAENLLIIRDPATTAAYQRNFESRLEASETLDKYESEHQR